MSEEPTAREQGAGIEDAPPRRDQGGRSGPNALAEALLRAQSSQGGEGAPRNEHSGRQARKAAKRARQQAWEQLREHLRDTIPDTGGR